VDVLGSGHSVKFSELLLFDVVATGSDCEDDYDSDEDGCTFPPSVFPTLGEGTQHHRNYGQGAEDTKHIVFEVFEELSGATVTSSLIILGGLMMGRLSP
jgi:hypothetical protein